MQKKSINSEPYRSRTFTRSPRRNTLAVGSSSSGPAAIAALADGAHDVASGAPSAIVVVWCVAVPSGVMLDVPCRLSRIIYCTSAEGATPSTRQSSSLRTRSLKWTGEPTTIPSPEPPPLLIMSKWPVNEGFRACPPLHPPAGATTPSPKLAHPQLRVPPPRARAPRHPWMSAMQHSRAKAV